MGSNDVRRCPFTPDDDDDDSNETSMVPCCCIELSSLSRTPSVANMLSGLSVADLCKPATCN